MYLCTKSWYYIFVFHARSQCILVRCFGTDRAFILGCLILGFGDAFWYGTM